MPHSVQKIVKDRTIDLLRDGTVNGHLIGELKQDVQNTWSTKWAARQNISLGVIFARDLTIDKAARIEVRRTGRLAPAGTFLTRGQHKSLVVTLAREIVEGQHDDPDGISFADFVKCSSCHAECKLLRGADCISVHELYLFLKSRLQDDIDFEARIWNRYISFRAERLMIDFG
jgi:hypothetical protein